MARYFAQVDGSQVTRVVVCEDPQWLADRLGGTWVETADPYGPPGEVSYPGRGWRHAADFSEKFVPPRRVPQADVMTGGWTPLPLSPVIADQDETTWITSAAGSADVAEFHLGRAIGLVRLSGRARKSGDGGQSVDLGISVLVDGVVVESTAGPNVPAAWSTYSIDLTLHGDVTVRVERAGQTGGQPNNRRAVQIAWIVMEAV